MHRFFKRRLAQANRLTHLFPMSFSSFSKRPERIVKFNPDNFRLDGTALVPISFSRYLKGKEAIASYDKDLKLVFESMAGMLKTGKIARVDVLLTGGLQKINWPISKCDEIDEYFLKTHKDSLKELSNFYRWDEFIDKTLGREEFEKNLDLVTSKSMEGSPWHELMCKTFDGVESKGTLQKSIEYQRTEYALIVSSADLYTYMPYLGKISPAWSYITHDFKMPDFCRILIEKNIKDLSKFEVDKSINTALTMTELIFSNPKFPENEKIKFFENMKILAKTYLPNETSEAIFESKFRSTLKH